MIWIFGISMVVCVVSQEILDFNLEKSIKSLPLLILSIGYFIYQKCADSEERLKKIQRDLEEIKNSTDK